ncbi:class I SAM-dependent methyltransferase [Xanthomonas arboricola]|uniref:Eco57I restriction-modification methylase domain-containing protein n=1 Tax=Xanthomonas arboricola TaxID=56448 RepID=UPI001C61253F|nr:class I SAM-dependent methyltransferase [Xanthomonas arboricola]
MIAQLEAQRIELQALLDAEKTSEQRNKMGQFATPSALAHDVLAHAQAFLPKQSKVRFLDPALGSGAFYAALLRVFGPRQVTEAQAFEIDPHYGQTAERLWTPSGLKLTHGDFTRAEPQPHFDLVICNPPYVRHHHLSMSEKQHLAERTRAAAGLRLSGLAGLYCHFLLQAHAWMAPGAIAGWLIPSEFMDVNYGQQIKDYLLQQVTLLHIHRFDPRDVQFSDALVSSAVVWFRNAPPPNNHAARFTFGGSLAQPAQALSVAATDLSAELKWTRFPVQGTRLANRERRTVGDLFKVKRGLATGDNGFFVLNEADVLERQLPIQALRPILPSARYVEGDSINADADGLPSNTRRLFLLDPRLDQADIEQQFPALAAYLAEGRARGLHERYLCSKRKRWYDQEQRDAAPIVCTYMGRSDGKNGRPFRFIRNRSQATVANSYLAMYPTPLLQERLATDPTLLDRVWEQLNAIDPADLLGEGRVYGGGLHKLEPKELAKVPLALD